jgi:hypothetical protein
MIPALTAWLAAGAQRELEARVKHYPAMVELKEMTSDEAERDIAAWRAIAGLWAEGTVETGLGWADLEAAAARALERREEAVAARPLDGHLLVRRDTVEAIHSRIAWHHRLRRMRPVTDGQARDAA